MKALQRSTITLAIAACWAAPAGANPTNPQVVAGQVAIAHQGKLLTITNSDRSIINWGGFSIAAGETTRFVQSGAASAVLNRVTGAMPSELLGQLQSNGRVYLINPNGIVIGNGARIDTAGFIASSLALSDADFLSGRLRFGSGDAAGSVINRGAIHGNGSLVALIGAQVENHGSIESAGGSAVAAAARGVELVDAYSPNIRVRLDTASDAQLHHVLNRGVLTVAVPAASDAAGLRVEGGRIRLVSAGDTLLEGSAVASADNAAGHGGSVHVLGTRVGLFDSTKVGAGGTAGGGEILVGGDYQGRNPEVINATRSFVGKDVALTADAIGTGDGGKVIVWADEVTRYHGHASVKGGAQGGNGGLVEVSGKQALEFRGSVALDAPLGRAGTLLLDPLNITVQAGAGTLDGELTVPGDPTLAFGDAAGVTGTLDVTELTGFTTGTVELQADNDITVNTAVTMQSGVSLKLAAINNVNVNANVTTSGGGNLRLEADTDASGVGAVTLGSVTIDAPLIVGDLGKEYSGKLMIGSNVSFAQDAEAFGLLTYSAGSLSVASGKTLTLKGGMNWTGGVNINGPGTISLPSGQTLAMSGAASRGFINTTFNNAGTTTSNIGGSQLVLNNSSIFNNSGTFRFLNNGDNISVSVGTGTFNNTGALEVSGAITNAVNNVAFTNTSGTLASGTGTLNLPAGGSHSGNITITGAGVLFNGGTHSFADSTTIAGQLNLVGATANFGTVTTNGLVNFSSGAITVTTGDTLTLNGGMNWTGGVNINGPGTISLPSGQTLAMSGAASRGFINTTFNNAGTTTSNIGGSQLVLNNSSIFNNSGTFRFLNNGDNISVSVGTGTFNNTGALEVSGAITNAVNNVAFTNTSGTLASGTGTLNLPAGGSHSGNITITGAGVLFNGGTHSFADSTTIAGQLNLVGATANFGTVTTNGLVNFSSGAINVTTGDTLTLNGGMNWTGGVNINGPGTISLPSGQTLAMSGAASRGFINAATFNNAGTTTSNIGGSQLVLNNSSIFNNSGTFRFLNNGDNISVSVGTGTFNNTGTLEVSGAITNAVNNVAFTNTGGTLASGTGTLNLNSDGSHSGAINLTGTAVNFAASTHSFADSTTIAGQLNVAGATANFGTVTTNGLVNFSNGAITVTSGDTLTLNGGMNWTGGVNINGPGTISLPSGQTLAMSGAATRGIINAATFNNAGTTTSNIGGSQLVLNNSSIFNNSGTFRFLGNGDNISVIVGTGTFNNTGTLEVSGAITNAVNNVAFTNTSGTLASGTGTLNLPAGGSHSGNITITGAGVLFNGGTHSFADSTTIAGQLNLVGATANFGTVTTNGLVNFSSGAINVTTGDTLTLNGGMNWTGGVNINGPGTISLPSGQTLAMSGAASRGFINAATFNNAGTTTSNIGGSQLVLNNSSIFNNSGTFRFLNNGDNISVSVGTGTFNNTGTLEVSGAITNAVNNVAFTNTGGTLASGTGTLNLNSDGSHSGAISLTGTAVNFAAGTHNVTGTLAAAPGSAFNVTGATVNLGDGSALSLADNLNFASGAINLTGFAAGTTINAGSTLTLSGQNFGSTGKLTNQGTFNAASTTLGGSLVNEGTFNVTTGNVTVSGGVSSLSGAITVAPGRTLDVAGTGLDWQGGTLAGTGTYNLIGGLSISGSGARVLNGPTFTINNLSLPGGSLDVQAGTLNLTGAASTSAGATLLVSGGTFTATGNLANAGTFTKTSAGTTTIAAAFSNAGTVNANAGLLAFSGGFVQSAGQVMLGGGALAGNLTLNGGTLGGAGTLTGNLVNTSGIVAPGNSPGLLTVAGDYTQGAGGQLNIELGGTVAGTGYDRLSVAGNATLDGTVLVTIPGAFAPGTGDLFDFMTIGGIRSGSFATTTLPTGYTGNVSYPAGLAQLQFSAVPATAVSSTATATTTALKIAAVDLFETLGKLSPSLMPAPPLAHDDEDEENNVGVVVCK